MGIFNKNPKEVCLELVEEINIEFRAISAVMHRNPGNSMDRSNCSEVERHFNNIVLYGSRFDRARGKLLPWEQLDLDVMNVRLWNGKNVDCGTWQFLVKETMDEIYENLTKLR